MLNNYDEAQTILAERANIEATARALVFAVLAVADKLEVIDDRLIDIGNALNQMSIDASA